MVDRSTFEGLSFFPYDPAWRFEAAVQPAPEQRLVVQSDTGEDFTLDRLGVIEVPGGALDVHWIDVYGGGVFLPVRDATSGTVTYGGGRYVLDTVKGADLGGALIVDFNFAYSPSCAFDPRWSCPLAPPGNRLAVAHRGGGEGTVRPFRFALQALPRGTRAEWQDLARKTEALGYSTLQTADHFGIVDPFSPLVSAADVTTTLRLGPLVINNALHHPGLLGSASRGGRPSDRWSPRARARHRMGAGRARRARHPSPVAA